MIYLIISEYVQQSGSDAW